MDKKCQTAFSAGASSLRATGVFRPNIFFKFEILDLIRNILISKCQIQRKTFVSHRDGNFLGREARFLDFFIYSKEHLRIWNSLAAFHENKNSHKTRFWNSVLVLYTSAFFECLFSDDKKSLRISRQSQKNLIIFSTMSCLFNTEWLN